MKIHDTGSNSTSSKFIRVFETLDDIRSRVVKLETRDESNSAELAIIRADLETVKKQLYQIVGKESVRSSIYGVIGAIVAAVVTWLITLLKGGAHG